MERSKYKTDTGYLCECGKLFDKSQSINAHFSRCIIHRNGIPPKKRNHGGGWSKGLTKTDHIGIAVMAKKQKELQRPKWTEVQKLAQSQRMKGKTGGFREGSNKWKGIKINNAGKIIWLDSSYEFRFVMVLNHYNIKWEKNYKKFSYMYENEQKNYIPDFDLPEINSWIETKGMVKDSDKYKWLYFPHNLKVLFKKELIDLECIKTTEEIFTFLKTGYVAKLGDATS